jgi:hypothetical protein
MPSSRATDDTDTTTPDRNAVQRRAAELARLPDLPVVVVRGNPTKKQWLDWQRRKFWRPGHLLVLAALAKDPVSFSAAEVRLLIDELPEQLGIETDQLAILNELVLRVRARDGAP